MQNTDFFRRLAGSAADSATGNAESAGLSPLYIYATSAGGLINVVAGFHPGADGFVVVQAGPVVKQGRLRFESNVAWNEGGTERTGWIHVWEVDGADPMAFFLPAFTDGEYYQGCATTLPYAPGQPPSGLDQPVAFQRWQIPVAISPAAS